MADSAELKFSNSEVRRAGERLAGDVIWTDDAGDEIHRLFRVANAFRQSHGVPMKQARTELMGRMMRLKLKGITAARLKRMPSIRRKLAVDTGQLNTITDIGGCRAILPTMADVRTLLAAYQQDGRFDIAQTRDYIESPKPDGYRCYHLLLRCKGEADLAPYKGRRIELQVRSRLQHSWATAVEAVGAYLGTDMKRGEGDADWLRLFQLMSAELAVTEGCAEPIWAPGRIERAQVLRELNTRLDAVRLLQNIRLAVQGTDRILQDPNYRAEYFLVTYDNQTRQVDVQAYSRLIEGSASYNLAEAQGGQELNPRFNSVLVQADRIELLKDAYPNYFGDVEVFETNLRRITIGKNAMEFALPPRLTIPTKPEDRKMYEWGRRTGARNPLKVKTSRSGSPKRET